MSGPLSPAAKKGDRISHDTATNSRSTDTILAAVLGQLLASSGSGGALSAQAGAGASCAPKANGSSPAPRLTLSITEFLPHSSTGTIEDASPTVFVAPGIGAALAEAHPVDCQNHRDKPIEPGTTTVKVQGLGLAKTGGQTGCGAILCDGAPTVLAGGPASPATGSGTSGGSPLSDAVAFAQTLAGKVSSAIAAVERGAALIEETVIETVEKVEGAVSGVLSSVTGALTSFTSGGLLGALTGATLAGDEPAPDKGAPDKPAPDKPASPAPVSP